MGEYRHGTSTGYNYHKCRCEQCLAWKKDARQREYERKGDEIRARNREYHAANKERLNAQRAERYKANPEHYREYHRLYQQENAEKVNAKNRAWRARHPDKARLLDRVIRNRRRGVPYTDEAIEWIKSLEDPVCVYCGALATEIDHILPVARGGTGERDNLAPACRSCNSRKGKRTVEEFLRRQKEPN